MFTKIKHLFLRYWIAALLVFVFTPLVAFMSVLTLDSFTLSDGEMFTFSKFGFDNITVNKISSDGISYYIPLDYPMEVSTFLASGLGKALSGSCSHDCSALTCGQANGCGETCVTQTCGDGWTCVDPGSCVEVGQTTCQEFGYQCGSDGRGGVCGTCREGEFCNGGYCQRCSCDSNECGNDGCSKTCGDCSGGKICAALWKTNSPFDLYYNCISCTVNCPTGYCGPDGCGGFCGCNKDGNTCDSKTNTCEKCVKSCEGKICGSDGCGGSCGECHPGELCTGGGEKCEYCTPKECTVGVCGSDGCGGTCECREGEACGADSKCLFCDRDKNCSGKAACASDGCGGTCGGEICHQDLFCDPVNGCQACSCEGKTCGTDGCGNQCGSCDPNSNICQDNNCKECRNDNLECGYSECGRYYGSCADGKICVNHSCQ